MTERILSFTGSSASPPPPIPKFLKRFQIQIKRISPIANATKVSYMVSAAGKYRRNTLMSQPSAPKTDVLIKSRPCMTCSAIHSTMPSKMPIDGYGFHCPPAKKGVI